MRLQHQLMWGVGPIGEEIQCTHVTRGLHHGFGICVHMCGASLSGQRRINIVEQHIELKNGLQATPQVFVPGIQNNRIGNSTGITPYVRNARVITCDPEIRVSPPGATIHFIASRPRRLIIP